MITTKSQIQIIFCLKFCENNSFEIIAAKAEVLDDVMKYMNELKTVIPLLADVAKHLNQKQVGLSMIFSVRLFVDSKLMILFSVYLT